MGTNRRLHSCRERAASGTVASDASRHRGVIGTGNLCLTQRSGMINACRFLAFWVRTWPWASSSFATIGGRACRVSAKDRGRCVSTSGRSRVPLCAADGRVDGVWNVLGLSSDFRPAKPTSPGKSCCGRPTRCVWRRRSRTARRTRVRPTDRSPGCGHDLTRPLRFKVEFSDGGCDTPTSIQDPIFSHGGSPCDVCFRPPGFSGRSVSLPPC